MLDGNHHFGSFCEFLLSSKLAKWDLKHVKILLGSSSHLLPLQTSFDKNDQYCFTIYHISNGKKIRSWVSIYMSFQRTYGKCEIPAAGLHVSKWRFLIRNNTSNFNSLEGSHLDLYNLNLRPLLSDALQLNHRDFMVNKTTARFPITPLHIAMELTHVISKDR